MPLYSVAVVTPAAAAAAAYAALRSSTRRAFLREMHIYNTSATASAVGLGRPATAGTASTSALGQAVDAADIAATCNADTAWSAAPTAPAVFMRRYQAPATIGAGVIWTFNRGELVVPIGGTVVLWNYGAAVAGALAATFIFEE